MKPASNMASARVIFALSIGSYYSVLLAEAFVVSHPCSASLVTTFTNAHLINNRESCINCLVSSGQEEGCRLPSFLTARKRRTTRKESTEEESEDAPVPSPASIDKPEVAKPVASSIVSEKLQDDEEEDDDGEEVDDDEEMDDDEYEYYYEDDEETAASVVGRGDDAVSLQVQDIRALIGRTAAQSWTGESLISDSTSSGSTTPRPRTSPSGYGGSRDDALEQLLADAKRMQLEEKDQGVDDNEEGGFSISSVAKNAISTIVTVDFFVVCAFLLWFLAGIFFSYVMEDDSVQIAFNGIFEPFVQPALGILMIGTIAGGVLKEEGEE